ncbi:protection of telomeres protein 1b-like isoform X2 [Arachis ipaensis]|uniref:protection of telomeres protein 1b-like isoform X2 n=1 Tax=Arachis ipaensis TaxID=130454 RepID=UPI000A2AF9A8|nr:protection of telomeres protein 1b-like isoform X2 [Arachis ipaensis]
MASRSGIKRVPIKDVLSLLSQRVSVVAVILEYSFPKTTRGTDYCCVLRIVDQSHHETGMAVNLFALTADKLPHVAEAGDVIHLCNVLVRSFDGEYNLVYSKAFSSFALYQGKDSNDLVPYQVSSKYQRTNEDRICIHELRKWRVDFQPNDGTLVMHPVLLSRHEFRLFKEIKEGDHVNLACKILHFGEVAKDEWFIYVWDGTDAPPNTIRSK